MFSWKFGLGSRQRGALDDTRWQEGCDEACVPQMPLVFTGTPYSVFAVISG